LFPQKQSLFFLL